MDFGKMFKKLETSHILACVAFLVLLWALMNYSNSKSTMGFNSNNNSGSASNPAGVAGEMPDMAQMVPQSSNNNNNDNGPRPSVTPNELLPKGATEMSTSQQLGGMNFLKAGSHVGVNTVSSSLRNANFQLRADPVIAKTSVGPWNNSTIESDLSRKPLEYCGE